MSTHVEPKIPVSLLVLTKDEEANIAACLESFRWCDDIHVFDSISQDRTCEIAREYGATITYREFDDWASHQNWALQNIAFDNSWVFYVDADERASPNMVDVVANVIKEPMDCVAFRVQRRDYWRGRWLKHVQASPYFIRLFRPEYVSYTRLVNPVTSVDGVVGDLSAPLWHFPFSKGISQWIERHNWYSDLEALETIKGGSSGFWRCVQKSFTMREFNERRSWQKALFNKLPIKPLIRFGILYVFRRGFLDGRPGLDYAILQAVYEWMIALKRHELVDANMADSKDKDVR